jgi:hypothetical protein
MEVKPTKCEWNGRCYKSVNVTAYDKCLSVVSGDCKGLCGRDDVCNSKNNSNYCIEKIPLLNGYGIVYIDYSKTKSDTCTNITTELTCVDTKCSLDMSVDVSYPSNTPSSNSDVVPVNSLFLYLLIPFISLAIFIPCVFFRLKRLGCGKRRPVVTQTHPVEVVYQTQSPDEHVRISIAQDRDLLPPINGLTSSAVVYSDTPPDYNIALLDNVNPVRR